MNEKTNNGETGSLDVYLTEYRILREDIRQYRKEQHQLVLAGMGLLAASVFLITFIEARQAHHLVIWLGVLAMQILLSFCYVMRGVRIRRLVDYLRDTLRPRCVGSLGSEEGLDEVMGWTQREYLPLGLMPRMVEQFESFSFCFAGLVSLWMLLQGLVVDGLTVPELIFCIVVSVVLFMTGRINTIMQPSSDSG